MKKIAHQDDRELWLAARKSYVTASEVVAALGGSKYLTREDMIAFKSGERGPEPFDSDAAELGLLLESGIAKMARRFGWALEPYGWLTEDSQCPSLAATPDFVMRTPWGMAVVDAKCTSAQAQEDCRPGSAARFATGAPLDYAMQVQAQMACLGREFQWGAILALHYGGKPKLRAYPIRRSEAVIADLRDAATSVMVEVNQRRAKCSTFSTETTKAKR